MVTITGVTDNSENVVLVEQRDRILIITINRPEAKNAVNAAVSRGLADAMDRLDGDAGLSVGVLTGAGGSFCAGMDLKAFARGENVVVEGRGMGFTQRPPVKPLIAAVEGYALAGGTELALATDLIVASKESAFGIPEMKRGLVAGGGGLLRLPQRIPYAIAMELALTGENLSAVAGARTGTGQRAGRTRSGAGCGDRAGREDHRERAACRGGDQADHHRVARMEPRGDVGRADQDPDAGVHVERRQGRRHRVRGEAPAEVDGQLTLDS